MKIKTILILVSLPITYAVSLSNFQRLPSSNIRKNCQDAYNSEIPFCLPTDFTEFCSSRCITGLYAIAEDVSNKCADSTVSANTLLGMVLSGAMVNILCPQPKLRLSKTSTMVPDLTSSTEKYGTETESLQYPIPTSTQDFDTTTSSLLTLTSQTLISGPKLTTLHLTLGPDNTSPTSISMVITTPQVYMTSQSEGANTITKTSSFQTSSSSKSVDSDTDSSGGGSPFDIQNFGSSVTSPDKTSFCAMVIALIWACLLQR